MNDKLYDLTPLNVLVDGNESFRKYLIELFNETTPPIIEDIKSSYLKKDWVELYAHSHKIKPTIESMGIYSMMPLINHILEEAKKKCDSDLLKNNVENFCKTIENTIIQLQTNELC
jgi:hypothetical protein